MRSFNNLVDNLHRREIDDRYRYPIQEKFIVKPECIQRLGLISELEGHQGCVNCLEWSSDGSVLASGSDDTCVILWDPLRVKKLSVIATGHSGNIFTCKFLPNTSNNRIVSGAADQQIRVHDVEGGETIRICTCHLNRVKRACVDPLSPALFWSAGEDGFILQHDLRCPHTCGGEGRRDRDNILIDLCQFLGSKAEAKCLSVNPVKTYQMAVGGNDPYARLYDRRMLGQGSRNIDQAVQYFVPGHLPSKFAEYRRKYRSLAATYVAFSPSGDELLVNLGGEQVYLYNLVEQFQTHIGNLIVPGAKDSSSQNGVVKDAFSCGTNGYSNGIKNGTHSRNMLQSAHLDFTRGMLRFPRPAEKACLSAGAEEIKALANAAFEEKKYAKAVHLYNEGLKMCPASPILYGNRSAALIKRGWDGDVYAAFKDCQMAFYLDPDHHKALIRMARCLLEMGRAAEAAECFLIFKKQFPEQLKNEYSKGVEKDILKFLSLSELSEADVAKLLTSVLKQNNNGVPRTEENQSAGPSRRRQSSLEEQENPQEPQSDSRPVEENMEMLDEEDNSSSSSSDIRSPSSDTSSSTTTTSTQTSARPGHKKPELFDIEMRLREKSVDFKSRFCGHCNTTTDIKEANFFGNRWILAGSDDGSFFIWDKITTNIVKVIKGDESIVNCLQPHPSTCLLATSGIESVVRLWSSMPEEGFVNDRMVEDITDAATANQKRMNSNPFEVILMNMGYRLTGNDDDGSEDDAGAVPACNPS